MCKQFYFTALATLCFAFSAPVLADEIYRWVDANGQVHYSDVPRDGAEQIELDPAQSFSSPVIARPAPAADQAAAEPVEVYAALDIVSPTQEETIWNTGGIITVSVSPRPALKAGHSIDIYYDGRLIAAKAPQATSVQLSEVYRGEHRIRAEIRDAQGRTVKQAQPVTFFYKQTSVKN